MDFGIWALFEAFSENRWVPASAVFPDKTQPIAVYRCCYEMIVGNAESLLGLFDGHAAAVNVLRVKIQKDDIQLELP